MEVTEEELRRRYSSMSEEELLELAAAQTLTPMAQRALAAELGARGIHQTVDSQATNASRESAETPIGLGGLVTVAFIFLLLRSLNGPIVSTLIALDAISSGLLTKLGSASMLATMMLTSSFALNALAVVVLVRAVFLFFQKDFRFPHYAIAIYGLATVAPLLEFMTHKLLQAMQHIQDSVLVEEALSASCRAFLVSAAHLLIWGTYFTNSARVKNTFKRGMVGDTLHGASNE